MESGGAGRRTIVVAGGMLGAAAQLAGKEQRAVDQALTRQTRDIDLVGTGEHARRLAAGLLSLHVAATVGPRGRSAANAPDPDVVE